MKSTTAQPVPGDERAEGDAAQRKSASKFSVIAELGRGGMADVFLAMARGPAGFNKLVVLKQIRQTSTEDARFLEMLLDEARLAALLNHPNIVQTNEVGIDDAGRHFLAMEYLEGQPLARILQRVDATHRELPLGIALRMASEALLGLHYAHELVDFAGKPLEVVHRDVSPHNLFVTYAGQVKVLDFGLAKAKSSSARAASGEIRGKLYYMAPEQASAQPVDRRSDVFSMGVVLWELITGQQLWRGQTDIAVACNLRFGEIPRLSGVAPYLPKALTEICDKALAFRPEERYATAAEFHAAIEQAHDSICTRASAEEVGSLVATLFTEERASLRREIEAHVASFDAERKATLNGSVEASPLDEAASSRRIARVARASARTRSRLVQLTVFASAIIATVSLAAMIILRQTPAPRALPSPQAAEASGAAKRAATAFAHVEIRARPSDARLFWDDAPLASNPFRGEFARDGSQHRVRAEAAGHRTHSALVTLDSDVTLDLLLEPEPMVVPAPAPAAARAKRKAALTPPAPPAPVAAPVNPPEFEDPWGGR